MRNTLPHGAGGYENFIYWIGRFGTVKKNAVRCPCTGILYTRTLSLRSRSQRPHSTGTHPHRAGHNGSIYTLAGLRAGGDGRAGLSYQLYEAVAYAAWRGDAFATRNGNGNPQPGNSMGKRWEWTESAYLPYPALKSCRRLGEYNGKFHGSQMVLRGASVATPADHSRPTYRNSSIPIFAGSLLAYVLHSEPGPEGPD